MKNITVTELIGQLAEVEGVLYLSDGQLKVKAPKGAMTAELVELIKAHKSDLIAYLEQLNAHESSKDETPPVTASFQPLDRAMLSSAQQRMWFIDQLGQGSSEYNMPIIMTLNGPVCLQSLENALTEIVQRHQILRTTYHQDEEGVWQRVSENFTLPLRCEDISDVELTHRETALQQMIDQEVSTAFDLQHDVMLRALYCRAGENEDKQPRSILCINLHHIAADGWSLQVLSNEFISLYRYFAQGVPHELEPLQIQYADYAKWQQQYKHPKKLKSQLEFWQNHLSDVQPVHQLPLRSDRPKQKGIQGAKVFGLVDSGIMDSLNEVAKQHKLTPFMLCHAVLALVLGRNSGTGDVIVGTPVANRTQSELESLIGFFVNTIVLRLQTHKQTLAEYFNHVRNTHIEAQANQDIPFEALTEHLSVERNTSYTPIFQILLTTNTDFGIAMEKVSVLEGLSITPFSAQHCTCKFDLDIDLHFDSKGLYITWCYDTALFDEVLIERFNEHLCNALSAISQHSFDTNQLTSNLPLFSDEEYHRLVAIEHDTRQKYGSHHTLVSLFLDRVSLSPESLAASFGDESISYLELDNRATELALQLHAMDVTSNDTIALYCERSFEMLIAMIATLKVGAAYLPIGLDLPRNRVEYILKDASPKTLLTQTHLVEGIEYVNSSISIIAVNEAVGSHKPSSTDRLRALDIAPDSAAYLLYTSGSTGQPKGVAQTHRTIVNLLDSMFYEIEKPRNTLQFTPYTFDVSVQEIFATLISGGTLHLLSESEKKNLPLLPFLLASEQIECAFLPPAVFEFVASENSVNKLSLQQLERVYLAGEQLTLNDDMRQLLAQNPQCQVFNHYGPTETHVVTSYQVTKESPNHVPIGKPLRNTQALILDDDLALVPQGGTGELYISGDGVALGYLNNDILTSDSFISNPFWREGQAEQYRRLYKTGDRVKTNRNGDLIYCGRADNQVKLRGFRIELSEIEQQLCNYQGADSALALLDERSSACQLVAYVVAPKYSQDSDFVNQLIEHLELSLPDYMVPSQILIIDSWPLTHNGKVDKKALPQPSEIRLEFSAAKGPVEQRLATLWAELLECDVGSIDRKANFFSLGGHSLMATKLLLKIRRHFEAEIALATFMQSPDIASMAAHIEKAEKPMLPPLPCLGPSQSVVVSSQQRRWFLLNQLRENNSAADNLLYALKFNGALDKERLSKAFSCIIEKHEILRTSYCLTDEDIFQQVEETPQQPVLFHDIATDSTKLEMLMQNHAQVEFDLKNGVVLHIHVYMLADDEHVLLLNMHHIAADAQSISLLMDELQQAYNLNGDVGVPLCHQYKDFAQWQQKLLADTESQSNLSQYWMSQLQELPICHQLPLSRVRPKQPSFDAGYVYTELTEEQVIQITQFAKAQQTTPFVVLEALFALLLNKYSGEQDIVVGTPVLNRSLPELESMIGCFLNNLVLRNQVEDNDSFLTYLARSQNMIHDAFAHQDMPFEQLVEILKPERQVNMSPLFQIFFSFNNVANPTLALEGLEWETIGIAGNKAKYDLSLNITASEKYQLQWEYASELFDAIYVERLATHFLRLITQVLANVNCPVGQFGLLEEHEIITMLRASNPSLVQRNPDRLTTVQLFAMQVLTHPDKIAVIQGSNKLSYHQLDQRINKFAHWMSEYGLDSGDVIGLAVAHSLDMLCLHLAAMKLGIVYVPLDKRNPPNRLMKIAHECNMKLLVSDESMSLEAGTLECIQLQSIDINYYPTTDVEAKSQCSDSVYVLFTSGSTGTPKGVEVSHGALSNFLLSMAIEPGFSANDRLLSLTASTFDISGLELYLPLICGGMLVLGGPDIAADVVQFSKLLHYHEITVAQATPAIWQMMSNSGWTGKSDLKALCGGEPLSSELATTLCDKVGQVWNMFGPTETTIWSSVKHLRVNAAQRAEVTVGKPIDNTQIFILDEYLNPVPEGIKGEVFIAGEGLAKGYLNNADLNTRSFINNPFYASGVLPDSSVLMYKTGDFGKINSENELVHLGRKDNQVKLNGLRIELGEIEAALNLHPRINESLVLIDETAGTLTGYYIKGHSQAESDDVDPVELRTHLLEYVPAYMIPHFFFELTEFPLKTSGKVDRARLPKGEKGRHNVTIQLIRPVDEFEAFVVEQLKSILKIEDVGTKDNFFELGASSLDIVKLAERMTSFLGRKVSATDLFTYTNVVNLAAHFNQGEQPQFEQKSSIIERKSQAKSRIKNRIKRKR